MNTSNRSSTLSRIITRITKDVVQNRFGDRLKAVNRGVDREGAFYLFTLRLVPIFPFFIINLVMALTYISSGTP